jgi:hypothetical protein
MSPLAVQGDFISDLPAVVTPITELPGGLFEVEVPTGPVAGAYVNKKLTAEQLRDYLSGTASAPTQIRTYWPVIYLTKAEAIADGRPDNATLDQIPALVLCTGSVARVDLHPDKFGQELILVYDDRADPTVGLRGFIDGNFLRTPQTYDGLQPLKWVKKGGTEEALAGVRRYDPVYAKWHQDETMKIDFGGTDAFFSAVAAGGPFPPPTAAGVATADWKPAAKPPGQDLTALVTQHTQQLATLGARAANLYAHYANNSVAPFADLDTYLAAANANGGTLRLQGEATSLYISSNNRGGWPAFWDAAGSTIVVPDGLVLRSSAAGLANFNFANFYLDGGTNGTGIFNLTGQLPQATSAGAASLLFNGQAFITVNNDNNVVLLDGGYYKKITGAGKYYLLGSVQVDDLSGASNVVDLRGGSGAGTGTVKTVNGAAPDAAGNVTLASRDLYGYSAAKRSQVFGLFTTANQVKAVDVALAGDTSTGIGSQIPDLPNGVLYLLVPDPDNPMPGPNGSVIGTPTWLRTRS